MNLLRLKTFGGLCLEGSPGGFGGRAAQRRRLALLARLAVARGMPVSRDKLVALLWPERDTAAARHSLAQTVYAIRQALGEGVLVSGPADDLRLDPRRVSSDVADFEEALERGALERAVTFYTGAFLDGFFVTGAGEFERWVEQERTRLERACAVALEGLARAAAQAGDASRAAETWLRLGRLQPLQPSVTLATMRALVARGDSPGALREAARHAAALRADLDLAPDTAVAAYAAELRAAGARDDPQLVPAPVQAFVRPGFARRRAVALAAGVVVLFGGLGLATQLRFGVDGGELRPVVLGSVTSNDAALGLAIREALRAELDATPRMRVLTDGTLQDALRLMAVPADTPVGSDLAVEIAQRRGIPFAVVGSAVAAGEGAALTLQVLDGRTGRIVLSVSEHAEEPGAVLEAVARLARRLRERVSGIPTDILTPLPAVTTASLHALRSYVLAREAAGAGRRWHAVELAEVALAHDSAFALAHYLLGDILWYADRQERSDYHLARAVALSDRLPLRERLIVRARYEQLVADRPDSALVVWRLLRRSYPDDVHAPEGMAWAYRALGDFHAAAAAADTALRLDASAEAPNRANRIHALLAAGDTAEARVTGAGGGSMEVPIELLAAFMRSDLAGAERMPREHETRPVWQQIAALGRGRLLEAERAMAAAVAGQNAQEPPRALLLQAQAELGLGGSAGRAAARAREAFEWMQSADVSPPAYARLAERIADVAARSGDLATLDAVHEFIERRDAGRGLRTYRMAGEMIEACRAFAAGDYARAAALARATSQHTYFWRTMSVVLLLQADALAAHGERDAALTIYRRLLDWPVPLDGDYETWPVMRAIAERAVARLRP